MIVVNDEYFIEVDSMNYTSKRKKLGKTDDGEEKEIVSTIGFFGSIETALEGIRNDMVRQSMAKDKKSLESAIREVKKINEEFTTLFKKIIDDLVEDK